MKNSDKWKSAGFEFTKRLEELNEISSKTPRLEISEFHYDSVDNKAISRNKGFTSRSLTEQNEALKLNVNLEYLLLIEDKIWQLYLLINLPDSPKDS